MPGEDGPDGPDGPDGENGTDGTDRAAAGAVRTGGALSDRATTSGSAAARPGPGSAWDGPPGDGGAGRAGAGSRWTDDAVSGASLTTGGRSADPDGTARRCTRPPALGTDAPAGGYGAFGATGPEVGPIGCELPCAEGRSVAERSKGRRAGASCTTASGPRAAAPAPDD
ncbi:hypothetical protein [Kitasatospora xanthocidica]|uniref:hypothetical protein n=1 Tax=Kitasatospora xanthocidica TaxID=83382 RepID=UPI001671F3C4|nr:hypothetical protein [Kitasatospora xanthocidica]